MEEEFVIKDDDVIILCNGCNMKIFRIKKDRKIFTDRVKFSPNAMIGQPYGSRFQVEDGVIMKLSRPSTHAQLTGVASGSDNKELFVKPDNQKLCQEDIEKMKEDGVSGDKIVKQLIENSKTFSTKTEFSQEKYIKKKKLKHEKIYRVLQPTSRLLARMYFERNPSKIWNLREDSLAEMLHNANVHAGITAIVVDSCRGLIVASVLEKMAGRGRVVHLFSGDFPSRQAVSDMNFSDAILSILYSFPLNKISTLGNTTGAKTDASAKIADSDICDKEKEDNEQDDDGPTRESKSEKCDDTIGNEHSALEKEEHSEVANADENNEMMDISSSSDVTRDNKHDERKEKENGSDLCDKDETVEVSVAGSKRQHLETKASVADEKMNEARQILLDANVDCLIIGSKYHPLPLVTALYKHIAPARPIVVHCQHQEPLMETFVKLKEDKMAVNVRLTEKWYRQYQVLPERTHPQVNMSGTGGYLLSATTVAADAM